MLWMLFVPLLLLVPVLGGRGLWFHAHAEDADEHLHIAPAAELQSEHGVQDEDCLASGAREDEHGHPRSIGFDIASVFFLPRVLATGAALDGPALAFPTPQFCARIPEPEPHAASHRIDARPGWPPRCRSRSLVAEILRTSHALLI